MKEIEEIKKQVVDSRWLNESDLKSSLADVVEDGSIKFIWESF